MPKKAPSPCEVKGEKEGERGHDVMNKAIKAFQKSSL